MVSLFSLGSPIPPLLSHLLSPHSVAPSVAHRAFPPLVISTCGGPLSFSQSLFSTRSLLYMLSLTTLMKSGIGCINARVSPAVNHPPFHAQARPGIRKANPPLLFPQLLLRPHPGRPLRLHPLLPRGHRPLLFSHLLSPPRRFPALPPRYHHLPHLRTFSPLYSPIIKLSGHSGPPAAAAAPHPGLPRPRPLPLPTVRTPKVPHPTAALLPLVNFPVTLSLLGEGFRPTADQEARRFF